jgi:hypothetical protein
MGRIRASLRIALIVYGVMIFIGLVTAILAANAQWGGDYWSLSRSIGLRREKLGNALIPGLALMGVGGVGIYRGLLGRSSRRHRRK